MSESFEEQTEARHRNERPCGRCSHRLQWRSDSDQPPVATGKGQLAKYGAAKRISHALEGCPLPVGLLAALQAYEALCREYDSGLPSKRSG